MFRFSLSNILTYILDMPLSTTLDDLQQQLAQAGIELCITRKRVKNFNFRLKPSRLNMSVPTFATDKQVAHALQQRMHWIISQHEQIIKRQAQKNQQQDDPVLLWGARQSNKHSQKMTEQQKIELYRQELEKVMPDLFSKWQPIVGATANETRIKKMRTRWGSCNTRAKRIWLSAYLPAYPIECTEYVIVHELCHLHHPNHSREFWQAVKTAMPEYRRWHDQLAGKFH